jgi:integrase
MSIQELKNGTFRVQLRHKGFKPFDKVFKTKGDAVAAEKAELDRRNGVGQQDGVTMKLRAAADRYLDSVLFSDKKEKTQYEERRNLIPVLEHLGDYTLLQIAKNLSLVTQYRDMRRKTISERTKKRIGAAKVRCELAALSSIYLWAVDGMMFPANPLIGIARGSSPQRKRRYEGNEETTLILLTQKAKDPWAKEVARYLLTQLEIGCRNGELADVNLDDIDMLGRELKFRDTKNGTDRTVYLTDVALQLVGDQYVLASANGQQRLYCSYTRSGKERHYNYRTWVDKLKEGGLLKKDFIPYAGRKEFVSRGMENDISLPSLQQMTGHKSLQAIQRYQVDIKTTEKTKAVFEEHSEEQQIRAAERTIAALPPHLRDLFVKRLKREKA